jgi:formylglycine-generating enzyme required for sulfatase activity
VNVTCGEARSYAAWLSRITGKTYRLLSEAEYEYAARAGTMTVYPWGDDIKLNGSAMANYWSYPIQLIDKHSAPVGSFPPNNFGLYDMVGNVWEWLEDCWHYNYNGAPTDGSPWTTNADCSVRVVRGGSFTSNPPTLRSADRLGDGIGWRNGDLGFRVARTLAP